MILLPLLGLGLGVVMAPASAEPPPYLTADLQGRWTQTSRYARENALPWFCTDSASGRYDDALEPLRNLAKPGSPLSEDERGAVFLLLEQGKTVEAGYSTRKFYQSFLAHIEVFARNATPKEDERRNLIGRCWLSAEVRRCANNKPAQAAPNAPARYDPEQYDPERCARIAAAPDAISAYQAVEGSPSGSSGNRVKLGNVSGLMRGMPGALSPNDAGLTQDGRGGGKRGTTGSGSTPAGAAIVAGGSSGNREAVSGGTPGSTSARNDDGKGIDYRALNKSQGAEVRIPGRLSAAKVDEVPPPGRGAAAGAQTVVDPADPANRFQVPQASADDIKKIVDTFHWSVDRMVRMGQRASGSGGFNGWWTDFQSDTFDDKKKKCYDQAHQLLHDLAATFGTTYTEGMTGDAWPSFKHGSWTFRFTGYAGTGEDANGHFWVTAVSSVREDPSIVMDPWRNEIKFVADKNPTEEKPWTSKALGWLHNL